VQVQALEQQASELSTLLGRQSGDVTTQPQQMSRDVSSARPSMESLDGTSVDPTPFASISGGSDFVPSEAGSAGETAAEAAATGNEDADANAAHAAEAGTAPDADAATAGAAAEILHPLAEPMQAAHTQTAKSSAPRDVPQLRAVLRDDQQLSRSGSGNMDSPSRHQFDGASAAVCALPFIYSTM
jgi:hypothetical protein